MSWLPTFMKMIFVWTELRSQRILAALVVTILLSVPTVAPGFTRSLSVSELSGAELFAGDLFADPPWLAPDKIMVCPVYSNGHFTDLVIKTIPQETRALRRPQPPRERERTICKRTLDSHRATMSTDYAYNLGSMENSSHVSSDIVLPWKTGEYSTLFFEGHTIFENPSHCMSGAEIPRIDCSLGVGYRNLIHRSWLLGVNGFLDIGLLNEEWHWSPGFGFEADVRTWDWQCADLSLNFYRGGGIDLQAGYTFSILDDRADFRVMAAKYRFFDGEFILGWRTGVGLYFADRTVGLTYEFSQDSRNPACHTVGLQASLSFRLEDLFAGKPAFWKPDPVRPVKRNLANALSENVGRMWRQPASVVASRHTAQGRRWTTPGKIRWCLSPPSNKDEKAGEGLSRSDESDRSTSSKTVELPRKDQRQYDDSYKENDLNDVAAKTCLFISAAAAALTYAGIDYTYKSAFGPYELEPYEKARIEVERRK